MFSAEGAEAICDWWLAAETFIVVDDDQISALVSVTHNITHHNISSHYGVILLTKIFEKQPRNKTTDFNSNRNIT